MWYLLLVQTFISFRSPSQTVVIQSSNLPLIIINTNGQKIVDEPKIEADMGIIFNGEGVRNHITDSFNHYNGKVGIELRGKSSQYYPQKPYTIELHDALGQEQQVSLFGMHKESDWVLHAPFADKSLMRNALAYTMSREMGRWAPRGRHVELILNGEYMGIYVLFEKIKWGNGRVEIAKMTDQDNSGDEITGGYIFSLDKAPNGWFSRFPVPNAPTNGTKQFSYVYPRPQYITELQKSYIQTVVDAFETSLWSANFQDPQKGYKKYIDQSSFVDHMLINEISRNVDAYRSSSYYYKDRDSRDPKIYAGPIWDFDLAFRNADFCNGSEIGGWAYNFNYVCPSDGAGLNPFWWERFLKDSIFQGELRCKFKSLTTNQFSLTRINSIIDSISSTLSEAQVRHFTRWPILGTYVWPNPQPLATTYAMELQYLKNWISERINWMSYSLPNNGACYDFPTLEQGSLIVKAFPVPLNTSSLLNIQSKFSQNIDLTVTDLSGRLVQKKTISLLYGVNRILLNSDAWNKGIYFIQIMNNKKETIRIKVLK
ncbi:MAG: CotH kinase family protein [Chitinophagaceae bacterium]